MRRTHLFTLALAASLLGAAGCGGSQATSENIDHSIKAATENIDDAALIESGNRFQSARIVSPN